MGNIQQTLEKLISKSSTKELKFAFMELRDTQTAQIDTKEFPHLEKEVTKMLKKEGIETARREMNKNHTVYLKLKEIKKKDPKDYQISLKELEQEAKILAKKHWGLEFNLPITVNPKISITRLAQYRFTSYRYQRSVTPTDIQFSEKLLYQETKETIISVLLHELAHWALSVKGLPFDDGHPIFEAELKKVGSHSTKTNAGGKLEGEYLVLYCATCTGCGKIVLEQKTKNDLKKYLKRSKSLCCKKEIEYAGTTKR